MLFQFYFLRVPFPVLAPQCGWYLSLMMKYVSGRQQKDGFCFLILSASSCLFIGELRPLIFRINIERFVLILTILLICFLFSDFFLMCFLDAKEGWILFSNSICLCLLIRELRPFMSRVINSQCYFVVMMWPSPIFWVGGLRCFSGKPAFLWDLVFLFCCFQYLFIFLYA